jgi:small subunit ribosomal protein S18
VYDNDDLDNEFEEEPRETRRRSRGDRGQDSDSDQDGKRQPFRKMRRQKEDYFQINNLVIDYKDVDALRRFMTDRAKIRPRRQTGLTSKHQRMLARQIKRARYLALLPFTDEHMRGS